MITSNKRDSAVRITSDTLTEGELKSYPSFVNQWYLHVFPDQEIAKRVAKIETNTMETVADRISKFTELL